MEESAEVLDDHIIVLSGDLLKQTFGEFSYEMRRLSVSYNYVDVPVETGLVNQFDLLHLDSSRSIDVHD